MEQNWEFRNKLIYLWAIDFLTRVQSLSDREIVLQQIVLDQLEIHLKNNKYGPEYINNSYHSANRIVTT